MGKLPMSPYWLYCLIRRREHENRGIHVGCVLCFKTKVGDVEWEVEDKQYWKGVVKTFKASTDYKRLSKGFESCDKLLKRRKAVKKAYNQGLRGADEEAVESDEEEEERPGAHVCAMYYNGILKDSDDVAFTNYARIRRTVMDNLIKKLERTDKVAVVEEKK